MAEAVAVNLVHNVQASVGVLMPSCVDGASLASRARKRSIDGRIGTANVPRGGRPNTVGGAIRR